jgi:uncharacterized membrane protein
MNKIVNIKVEMIFLVLCLFFGVLFVVITPPLFVADETFHVIKAFDVSQGHFIQNTSFSNLPKSFHYNIDVGTIQGSDGLWRARNYSSFSNINYTPFNINDTQEVLSTASGYMFLPYLGVALVIKVGELFNTSPLLLLYFGRLINLFIYAIFIYFGIKIVPIGKYIFLLIALMPTSLYLASSVSADSLNLGLSIFTICLFLNLIFKKDKIMKKDIIFISSCILGLALSKEGYALLSLLFFMIPKDKFKNMKSRILYFIYTVFPSIIIYYNFYLITWINCLAPGLSDSPISQNANNGLLFFLSKIIPNIITQFNKWCIQFVGNFAGWPFLPLPLIIVYLYLFVLIFVSILDKSEFRLSLKQKIISVMIFLCLFNGLLYGWWIWSDRIEVIHGIQGRYFIPFSPLFFLILRSKKISDYFDRKNYLRYLNIIIIGIIIFMLSISTYTIHFGHFIPQLEWLYILENIVKFY